MVEDPEMGHCFGLQRKASLQVWLAWSGQGSAWWRLACRGGRGVEEGAV